MRRLLIALFAFLAPLLALVQPAYANHIAARLVSESDAPAAGRTVSLAIAFTPEQGWHGYWRNPGDAGAPTRVEWSLPQGVTAGELRYPVPQRLTMAGLMNYVFEGPHALLVDVTVPAGFTPGTVLPIRARVDYLACTDQICVPERADLTLDLRVGDGAPGAQAASFAGWRAALPRPLDSAAHFQVAGDRLRVGIPLPASVAVDDGYLYPLTENLVAHSGAQAASRNGDTLVVELPIRPGAAQPGQVDGVVALSSSQALAFTARPGDVPAAGEPVGGGAAEGGASTLLLAFLGALVGGLILNIMPCVFPILSLKALSLARAGEGERQARRDALAYSAGVIVTCLALGGLLLGLRAGGTAVGWAFQLQDPRIVFLLLLLVTAIALNLAGLYRLPGVSVERSGAIGAFGTGILAAFVATPCTGPFMAAALGTALVLPAAGAMLVFAGLGLGLALPFIALAYIPGLRRRLPRPGPWMERFQRILSVPMFATALALAWVLGRQTGVDGLTIGLAATLLLGLALWWIGGRGRIIPALLILAAAIAPLFVLQVQSAQAEAASGPLNAEPFTEARLAALRQEGRPVFLYFTADWCLTCKVNERGAMASQSVADAFARSNVAVLEGDWTLGDAAIGRFLEQQGRSGVPLYLYYRPGRDGEILPQVLTAESLAALAS